MLVKSYNQWMRLKNRKLINAILDHKTQVVIFFTGFLIFFSRNPDNILNAQFWAEDGVSWFADALNTNYSISTLFYTYTGYLTVVQRLTALISGIFSLYWQPYVYSVIALCIQCLPLVYLWSTRTNFITQNMKIYISIVYVLLPFTQEIHGNITNSQWYLAVLLFMLLFIKESKKRSTRLVDCSLIIIASLSGPFSIFLTPVVLFEIYRKKSIEFRHKILIICAIVQAACMLFTRSPSENINMGYSITKLFNIIAGQIFGAGLYGTEALTSFTSKPWVGPTVSILGIQLFIYIFIKSNKYLRYYLVYSSSIFLASLISVIKIDPGYNWWYYFGTVGFGGRYYYLLHLGVYIGLGWLVLSTKKINSLLRVVAAIIIISSLLIGVPRDYMYEKAVDRNYKGFIDQYYGLDSGQSMSIPINPGGVWQAILIKK